MAPRKVERTGVGDWDAASGVDSERERSCREDAACSVHAEMARVCWGDRLAWEPCGRSLGWMAIVRWKGSDNNIGEVKISSRE